MRPFDVECNLERPQVVRLQVGAVARRRWLRRRAALEADDVEPRRGARRAVARRIAWSRLAAQVRQAERIVEVAEVLPDRRRAERVDDRDRLALALVAGGVERRVV